MTDSKFDPGASRREFISNAESTLAAAAVLPTFAAVNLIRRRWPAPNSWKPAGELH